MYWISPQPLTGWPWQRPPLTHPLSCGPLCDDPGETHGGAVVVVGGAAIVTDDETGSPANGPLTSQIRTASAVFGQTVCRAAIGRRARCLCIDRYPPPPVVQPVSLVTVLR